MKATALGNWICLVMQGVLLLSTQQYVMGNKQHYEFTINLVDSLNKEAFRLNYSDGEQSMALSGRAMLLARKIDYHYGLGQAWLYQSIVHRNRARYKEAINTSDSAMVYFRKSGDRIGIASTENSFGNIYYYLQDYAQALKHYQRAHDVYKAEHRPNMLAVMLNNLGLAHSEMSNFTQALEHYFEALAIHESVGNEHGEGLTLANIGIVYSNLRNYDEAMAKYEKSLEIRLRLKDDFGIAQTYSNMGNVLVYQGNPEKAIAYYQKALEIFKAKGDVANAALTSNMLGFRYMEMNEYEKALEHYETALHIYDSIGDHSQLAYTQLNKGLLLQRQGELDASYAMLESSRMIYENSQNLYMLSKVFQALAMHHELHNNPAEALHYFKRFFDLHDSLLNIEATNRVAAAELNYLNEKKETELTLLRQEKDLEALTSLRHRQGRNFFMIITLLVVVAILLILARFRLRVRFSREMEAKNKALSVQQIEIEKQKQRIEKQYSQLKNLDDAKTRFFANISHEFRTPLTLIQGPLEDVLKRIDNKVFAESDSGKIALALRHSRQLNRLIDQLLDLSKLKAGAMKLKASRIDLIAFLKRISGSFLSAIPSNKKINICLDAPKNQIWLYVDVEKLEQVFNNLLSNAVKAIPNEGEIRLVVRQNLPACETTGGEGRFVEVDVCDNGTGIRESDVPQLFNRFFRADDSGLQREKGTGIGLEYTRELVELHGGDISVKSTYGEGSIFTLSLPLGIDHLEAAEIIPQHQAIRFTESPEEVVALPSVQKVDDEDSFTVLLVEDHAEMREYIAGQLMAHYRLLQARNGKIALEVVDNELPDLIVSDLMMPEMDGLTLLHSIRNNPRTEDLPFILLTAKAGDENRLAGYAEKADAYITKPFKAEELLLRIGNLLENRKRLEEKLSKKVVSIDLQTEALEPADRQFVERLRQTIVQHIADASFGIVDLAGSVFLSERQFRRKLTALTGMSPIDFVRQVRLLHAKKLIEQQTYETIAEVAAASGFNNPAYFARLFKKLFGFAPNACQPLANSNDLSS